MNRFSSYRVKKSPPKGAFSVVGLLLQVLIKHHVERIEAEAGVDLYTHMDGQVILLQPLSDAGKVVLVQESHVIGLQRMIEVHRHIAEEFAVFREHENGEGSVVAVLLFLEEDTLPFIGECFHR